MRDKTTRKHIDTYLYRDAKGEKIVKKHRYLVLNEDTGEWSKDFLVFHRPNPENAPNGWSDGVGPYGTRLMYRLPQILRAMRDGEDVYWCEGEKDAKSAFKTWGIAATSHHQGGAPANLGQAEWFAGTSSTIYLVMDRDDRGQQAAWDHYKLLRKLKIPRRQIVLLFPAVQNHKADLTDHIEEGYDLDDLRELSISELRHIIDRIGPLPRGGGKAGGWGSGGSDHR